MPMPSQCLITTPTLFWVCRIFRVIESGANNGTLSGRIAWDDLNLANDRGMYSSMMISSIMLLHCPYVRWFYHVMVMLLHCRYDAATLQRRNAATLLRCYVATLLRCYSATLLCYYGSVIVLLFQRRRSLAIPESKKHLEKSPSKCKYVLAVRFSELF